MNVIEFNYVDDASPYATVTAAVAASASVKTRTVILTYEVKNGKNAFLRGVRNSVSGGGEPYIYFSVLINGNPLENFDRIQNMVAAPEDQQGNLLRRKQLPQGAIISVVADNSDPSNTYSATAKLEIGYEAF